MPYRDTITDAELDIMKALWKIGTATSPAIFAAIPNSEEMNTGTLKTLLSRLVSKGAVKVDEINLRHYLYTPVVTEREYIRINRKRMIDKVFDGSVRKMLLNFIEEEKITGDDLKQLIQQIEADKDTEN